MSETRVEPTGLSFSALPDQRLSPVLNPLLASHMGRWAEIYYTTPVAQRDEAVEQLLRQLEAESGSTADASKGSAKNDDDASVEAFVPLPDTDGPQPAGLTNVESSGADSVRNREEAKPLPHANVAFSEHAVWAATSKEQVDSAEPFFQPNPAPEEQPSADLSQVNASEAEITPISLAEQALLPSLMEAPAEQANEPSLHEQPLAELVWEPVQSSELPAPWAAHQQDDSQDVRQIHNPPPAQPLESSTPVWSTVEAHGRDWGRRNFAIAAAFIAILAGAFWTWNRGSALAPATAIAQPANEHTEAGASSPVKPSGVNAQVPESDALKRNNSAKAQVADTYEFGVENVDPDLNTGLRYLRGETADHNSAEAAHYLWKAVGKQNGRALVELAGLYAKGDGVTKDCDQAKVLMEAAARHKIKELGTALETLHESGCE